MKLPVLEAPAGQNWSCHGCSKCCRGGLLITLDAADRQRILDQNWSMADGVDPKSMMVPHGRGHRLGHQADGACIFLDPAGRCRIHARFGEAAKPLPCRLYPLTYHPSGPRIAVGVRFDCPSAVANRGATLASQLESLRPMAPSALQGMPESVPAPLLFAGVSTDWPTFHRVLRRIDAVLGASDVPVSQRWIRGMHGLAALRKAGLGPMSGRDADSLLEGIFRGALTSAASAVTGTGNPSFVARVLLRQQVLDQARRTTVHDLEQKGRHRWLLLKAAVQFLSGSGNTPDLGAGFTKVPFNSVESMSAGPSAEIEALLTRYFRVKLQSLAFCGVGYHGLSMHEGFLALALQQAVITWLARWHAVSAGRTRPGLEDFEQAIQRADHNWGHGRNPASVLRLLMQKGDLERLCVIQRLRP